MGGKLTTHVLDMTQGCPAAGIEIRLSVLSPDPRLLCRTLTNADGRCDRPLLEDESFRTGRYELVFCVGAYFAQHFANLPTPAFLDEVILRFGIAADGQHYHVPLLVSPYGYSTYRGS